MSSVVPPLHRSEDEALWQHVFALTQELKALKQQLQQKKTINTNMGVSQYGSNDYFLFVATLRNKMKANVEKKYYPSIRIDGKKLGMDFNGLLYDKKTNINLTKSLAFEVYHSLYDQHLIKPYFEVKEA